MRSANNKFSALAAPLALIPLLANADVGAEPPGGSFQKVSDLVELPEFVPGLGVLYVDPATLPAGPFLAYDRQGELVSTIYMIPTADLEAGRVFSELSAPGGEVEHVEVNFAGAHPGVEEPHVHVILWHTADTARVAE